MSASCSDCGSDWGAGQHGGPACAQCGDAAISTPCVVCRGVCGRVWTRNVAMSQAFREAHFDGSCGLPPDQQQLLLLRLLAAKATLDEVAADLADLL